MQVPGDDRRPTGAPQLQKSPRPGSGGQLVRHRRPHSGAQGMAPASLLARPQVRDDSSSPARRAPRRDVRAGVTAHQLLRTATAPDHPAGPLPRRARRGGRVVAHGPSAHPGRRRPDRRRLPARASPPVDSSTRGPVRPRARSEHPGQHLVARTRLQRGPRSSARLARSRRSWAPGARCRAAGMASTSARRWSGGPRSRWRPPDEHAHEYHFDEPPADLWDGIEPDPATLVDHATDHDWADWPLAEDPGPYDEHLGDVVDGGPVDASDRSTRTSSSSPT